MPQRLFHHYEATTGKLQWQRITESKGYNATRRRALACLSQVVCKMSHLRTGGFIAVLNDSPPPGWVSLTPLNSVLCFGGLITMNCVSGHCFEA